jgi:hypothetical protein
MNEASGASRTDGMSVPSRRKPYRAPELVVFGHVAALTQSASGCNMSDNSGCTTGVGSNMGVMI